MPPLTRPLHLQKLGRWDKQQQVLVPSGGKGDRAMLIAFCHSLLTNLSKNCNVAAKPGLIDLHLLLVYNDSQPLHDEVLLEDLHIACEKREMMGDD